MDIEDACPINISPEDDAKLTELSQTIDTFCNSQDKKQELCTQPEQLSQFLEQCRQLADLSNQVKEDLSDLAMMYTSLVEHNTGLEDELVEKNKHVSELVDKMKKYLSTQLFDRIMGGKVDAKTGSHKRKNLTIFFSDIVGFTDITDTIEPENLSYLLNTYLDEMAIIASKWGGTIDKFIGDAVMIFFGDDEDIDNATAAKNCVLMALEMQHSMNKLREKWAKKGIHHILKVRIGINTGYCTVGNFGSEERMDYTLIGGNVNVASRLEGQCPHGGILISASTQIHVKDIVKTTSKGAIKVKGVAHPIETYEVLGEIHNSNETKSSLLSLHSDEGFDLKSFHYNPKETSFLEKEEMLRSLVQALAVMTKN